MWQAAALSQPAALSCGPPLRQHAGCTQQPPSVGPTAAPSVAGARWQRGGDSGRPAPCRAGALAASSSSSSGSIHSASMDEEEWEATYGLSPLKYGISLEQGLRETMEDATQVVPHGRHGFFFATVFDGHGGFAAAEYLQQNLYRIFTGVLDQQGVEEGLEISQDLPGLACPVALTPALADLYMHADADLLQWMHANVPGEERTSGCTATTCLVRRDLVVVANVGDSRAVLCRGGRALNLSAEHRVWGKTPNVLSEIERIESVGGWVDDGRVCGVLAVSRAFGDMEFKGEEGLQMLLAKGLDFGLWDQEFADSRRFTGNPVTSQPDVTELALHEGDEFLVVASDGLWDVLDSPEVVKLARRDLQRGASPQEAAEKLSALAVKRGSQDNVAVVLVDLGRVDWSKQGSGGGLFGSIFGSR